MSESREKALYDLKAKALFDARQIVDEAEKSGQPVLEGEKEVEYQRALADMERFDTALSEERQLTAAEDAHKHAADQYADATPEAKAEVDSFRTRLWNAIQREGDPGSFKEWLPAPSCVIPAGEARDINGNPVQTYTLDREKRTAYPYITAGTTTNANYAIPAILADQIEELAAKISGVLKCGANTFVTAGINTMYIPSVTTDLSAIAGTENTAQTDSSYAVLGRTTLTGYRRGGYAIITEEDIASSGPDMMAFLERALVRAIGNLLAKDLVIGTNSSTPAGALTAGVLATGVTAAATTTFTFDEVINTFNALSAEYWVDVACLMSQSAYGIAIKLKDDVGHYLMLPDVRGGLPNTILGYPVNVDAQGTTVAAAVPALAFGQWEHFHVRYGMGGQLFMDVSTEAQFTQWNRLIRAARWYDCQPGIAAAFSSLVMHS